MTTTTHKKQNSFERFSKTEQEKIDVKNAKSQYKKAQKSKQNDR